LYLCRLSSAQVYYYNPNGGLCCVWLKLEYSAGSRTNGYLSSTFFGDSEEGLGLLRAYYTKTAFGALK